MREPLANLDPTMFNLRPATQCVQKRITTFAMKLKHPLLRQSINLTPLREEYPRRLRPTLIRNRVIIP